MSVSKYIRIGLRADKNLSDLPDKNLSLGNIVDDLIPNQSFIPGDLTVINGLNDTDVWAADLAELTSISETYSQLTLIPPDTIRIGTPVDVEPRTRVIDQITNDEIVLGSPPYIAGGNGPIATVFPEGALTSTAGQLAHTSSIDVTDIFDANNPGNITSQDYWIDGSYGFSNSFHPSFPSGFGGISWDGYLSNHSRRTSHFSVNSFFLLEKYNESLTAWETVKRVTEESFTVEVEAVIDTETVTIIEADAQFLMIGLVVNGTHEITGISSGRDITLAPIGSAGAISLTAGDDITLTWNISNDFLTDAFKHTDNMMSGATQRVRITVWYPSPDLFSPAKPNEPFAPFGMRYHQDIHIDDIGEDTLPFNYFYDQPQGGVLADAPLYSFEHFRRNVITARNKHSENYFLNEQPLYHRYTPKFKVEEVTPFSSSFNISTVGITWSGGTNFAAASASIRDIDIGDYLLFAGFAPLPNNDHFMLQVFEKGVDTLTVDPYKALAGEDVPSIMAAYGYSVGDSIPLFIVKSKGVVGIYTQKSSSTTVRDNVEFASQLHPIANSNNQNESLPTTDFFRDDILIGDLVVNLASSTAGDTQHPYRFDKITSIDKSTNPHFGITSEPVQVVTNTADGISERRRTQYTYSIIYSHRGLVDNSTVSQCVNVFGQEVAEQTESSPGTPGPSSTIKLLSVDRIVPNQEVQFVGADINNPIIPHGTKVDTIDASANPPEITLKESNTTNPQPVTLPASVTLVFVPNGTGSLNKELCVMPLNTAPPFQGTDFGLETVPSHPHLVVGGDFSITGIKFDSATSTEIVPATEDADGGLLLKTPGGTKYWAFID